MDCTGQNPTGQAHGGVLPTLAGGARYLTSTKGHTQGTELFSGLVSTVMPRTALKLN